MKKIVFVAGCIILSAGAYAQQFYIKGDLGYAIPQAGQSIDGTGYPYNGSVTSNATGGTSFNYKDGASLSAGFYGSVGGGYMFNDHIGFEVDVLANLAPQKYIGYANNEVVDSIPTNITNTLHAKVPVFLAPQLVLQTGGDVWNFYARGGFVIPLSAHITEEQDQTNLPGNGAIETVAYTIEYKTKFSLGLTGAIGAQYNVNDNLAFFGELNMLSMSLYLKEADLKDVTINGTSYISQVSASQKVNYYSNNYSSTTANTYSSYAMPFSNIGMHIGIMYKFDKTSRTNSHARPVSHGRATE